MSSLVKQYVYHPLVDLTLVAQISNATKKTVLTTVTIGISGTCNGREVRVTDNSSMQKYVSLLKGFLDGKVCSLKPIKLFLEGYTDFQRSVLTAARKIPRGKTVSYKELAEMSGYPKAVRAVASVMRNNRFPLIIPCHRVIRSDGTLGGYAGQHTGKMVKLKKKLLDLEKNKQELI